MRAFETLISNCNFEASLVWHWVNSQMAWYAFDVTIRYNQLQSP